MSEIKFSCPHCQQHIQCDQGYAGMEIPCPTCGGRMLVPGTPPAPPPPVPMVPAANLCPGCGAALAPAAILCTQCGFNLRTGQRLQSRAPVPSRPAPGSRPGAARPPAPKGPTKWYLTPYPYLGAVALLFCILYLLGRNSEVMMAIFALSALLYVVAARIIVVVVAFKDSVGRGFLCLCIEIYTLYYVYKESESGFLKALYGIVLLLYLAFYTMKDIAE